MDSPDVHKSIVVVELVKLEVVDNQTLIKLITNVCVCVCVYEKTWLDFDLLR